jgi:hypothetical protein
MSVTGRRLARSRLSVSRVRATHSGRCTGGLSLASSMESAGSLPGLPSPGLEVLTSEHCPSVAANLEERRIQLARLPLLAERIQYTAEPVVRWAGSVSELRTSGYTRYHPRRVIRRTLSAGQYE